MSTVYLVAISTKGYKVMSAHSSVYEAEQAMFAFRAKYRGISVVLRHGDTGKRESVAEVKARILAKRAA